MGRPIIIFSAGTRKNKSGTAVTNLVTRTKRCHDDIEIDGYVAQIVTNHRSGGVIKRANKLGIPAFVIPANASRRVLREAYVRIITEAPEGSTFLFCGWTQWIGDCFPPERTLNVYRGARTGEPGLSYYNAHKIDATHFLSDVIDVSSKNKFESAIAFNFVTGPYCDYGPQIAKFTISIPISHSDVATLFFQKDGDVLPTFTDRVARLIKREVRRAQHQFLPQVLIHFLEGQVRWNVSDPQLPIVPEGYKRLIQVLKNPLFTEAM